MFIVLYCSNKSADSLSLHRESKVQPLWDDRANGGGWRVVAIVPGSVHLSRVLSSARIRSLFTGDSRFPGCCIECWRETCLLCDSPRSYALRGADRHCRWTRCGEAGPPLFAPASIKQISSDLRRVTKHTARIAVKTPSAAVFHSSARFSCPNRFHSCLAKVGKHLSDETEKIRSSNIVSQ